MRWIVFIGLFLPVVLAGMSVYAFKFNNKFLKLLVAFSGAYLISLIFNELIPQIYSAVAIDIQNECAHQGHNHHHNSEHHLLGFLILAGFFIQLILDYFTKGIEHGHMGHNHSHNHEDKSESSFAFIPIFIGLLLHSFLEGMPLADGLSSNELQNKLLTGIIIHNIPISVVLVSLMIQNNISKVKIISFLLIFALSAPAGALVINVIGTQLIEHVQEFFIYIMAIVVGIFLHISTTILFESDQDHKFNFVKFATMLIGAVAATFHF